MGQRGAHETFLTIVGAFVQRRRWTQAELARHAEVGTEVVRKHLLKMKADGWPLEESKDHPNVIWRVPAGWHPGILAFTAEELPDLLRVLARAPRTAARERLAKIIGTRLPLASAAPPFDHPMGRKPGPSGARRRGAGLNPAGPVPSRSFRG